MTRCPYLFIFENSLPVFPRLEGTKKSDSFNRKPLALKTVLAASCFKSLLCNSNVNIHCMCSLQCTGQLYHELWVASLPGKTMYPKIIF